MKQFISDFQAFISRGNVVDMAVGVIVGAAFTAIVNSLVKDVINPILGVLIGSQDFSNFFFVLSMPENYTGPMSYDALTKAGAAVFGYGAFFTAVFHFLFERGFVGAVANQKVVGLEDFELVYAERRIHCVVGLSLEIDDKSVRGGIVRFDLPEAPASV